MPITISRARRHTEEWSAKLAPFPVRANWPVHVFHTCQLEVAVEIIRSGQIKCRASVTKLICDVANQVAVWNNPEAHNYVRLYFRPRNSFHLKTEGVKAIGDPYRIDPHMSIPIAFAFDFQKMAEVHNWRMSEVVVTNALPLSGLSYVICRTPHEERTLRHALGNYSPPKIIVEQKGSIFMRRGMFVDEIYWQSNLLNMRFHGPTGYTKEKYGIKVICWDGGPPQEKNYVAAPGIYHFPGIAASKEAIWRVELEGCVVYHAQAPSTSGLVTS
jgi:hypothetical protein